MKAFTVCVFAAAMAAMASAAPTTVVDAKSLVAPVVGPVSTASHQESSFDKGAQQASSSSGQGSHAYDHGAQANKAFGNKESSGSKESFSHSANNAYNQGSGQFSHSGAFNQNNHLANFGQHHSALSALPVPGVPVGIPGFPVGVPGIPIGVHGNAAAINPSGVNGVPLNVATVSSGPAGLQTNPALLSGLPIGVPATAGFISGAPLPGAGVLPGPINIGFSPIEASSSVGSLQKGSAASGFSQGQGAWNYNQGQSSVNSAGNKETFSNKESFGQENAASHAQGAGQSSHAQNTESAAHDKGHQVASTSQVVG